MVDIAIPEYRYRGRSTVLSDFQTHISRSDLAGHVRHHSWVLGLFKASLAGQRWHKLGRRKALRLLTLVEGVHREKSFN